MVNLNPFAWSWSKKEPEPSPRGGWHDPSSSQQSYSYEERRIQNLITENDNLHNNLNNQYSEYDKLSQKYRAAKRQLEDEQRLTRSAQNELHEAQLRHDEEIKRLKSDFERRLHTEQNLIKSAENNLLQAEARHEETNLLLNQRTSELEAVQSFYPMTDSISGSELKGKVEAVNDEIMQQAAVITDALERAERHLTDDEVVQSRARELTDQGILDHTLVQALHSPNVDSFHVQLALQAVIVHAARRVITLLHPKDERHIMQLFHGITQTERYPISAKWRAVTHAQLCRTTDLTALYAPMFDYSVTSILMVGGWGGEAKRLNFPTRLDHLIDLAVELNQIIMQKVFTMQVEIIVFPPSSPFDSVVMEDESAEEPSGNTQNQQLPVLCTTSLGLAFSLVNPQATAASNSQWEYALKAKVITPRVFNLPPARA
ncbi:hypothetical protein BDN72DRAFT_847366 [Pluteus cervinus]|uniref:Uncharacterized protein n=1 Tax=Pluteus cervinus TaxID=181527 RepID=A0ACD3ADB6_9AGAR|nr:hypothetical protein BDN72DRAFT_847366 [Pluteus cervinus]